MEVPLSPEAENDDGVWKLSPAEEENMNSAPEKEGKDVLSTFLENVGLAPLERFKRLSCPEPPTAPQEGPFVTDEATLNEIALLIMQFPTPPETLSKDPKVLNNRQTQTSVLQKGVASVASSVAGGWSSLSKWARS